MCSLSWLVSQLTKLSSELDETEWPDLVIMRFMWVTCYGDITMLTCFAGDWLLTGER